LALSEADDVVSGLWDGEVVGRRTGWDVLVALERGVGLSAVISDEVRSTELPLSSISPVAPIRPRPPRPSKVDFSIIRRPTGSAARFELSP
jgi:hypothetical protein